MRLAGPGFRASAATFSSRSASRAEAKKLRFVSGEYLAAAAPNPLTRRLSKSIVLNLDFIALPVPATTCFLVMITVGMLSFRHKALSPSRMSSPVKRKD